MWIQEKKRCGRPFLCGSLNAALGFSLGDMTPLLGLTVFFFLKVHVSTSEWALKSSPWESEGIHRSKPGLTVAIELGQLYAEEAPHVLPGPMLHHH